MKKLVLFCLIGIWGFISFLLIDGDPPIGLLSFGLCLCVARMLERKGKLPKPDEGEELE